MRPGTLGFTVAPKLADAPPPDAMSTVWFGIVPAIVWLTESATRLIDVFTIWIWVRPSAVFTVAASDGSSFTFTCTVTLNGALPLVTFAGASTDTSIGRFTDP